MTASGYLSPAVAVCFALAAAAAAQLGALVAGRYAHPHAPVSGGRRPRGAITRGMGTGCQADRPERLCEYAGSARF